MSQLSGRVRPALLLCVVLALLSALVVPAVAAAGAGSVSGRVTTSTGMPVAGVKIRVYELGTTSSDSPWEYVLRTRTGVDGSWSIPVDEEAAGTYLVAADSDSDARLRTWYGRSPTPEGAQPVPFNSGAALAGVDIVLLDVPPPGVITGRLRGNGDFLAGIRVAAFRADQSENEWPAVETRSDASGRYSLSLPGGAYRVLADGSDFGLPLRYWPGSATFAGATLVTVSGNVASIDFDLTVPQTFPPKPGGRIAVPRAPKGLGLVPVDRLAGYQGQAKCRRSARPGTKALLRLILATYGTTESAGLNRACTSGTSEHYDGRAIDWMVHSRIPAQARKGDALTRWLTQARGREAGVMARRLGVMYVIWRGRIWKQYQASAGWQTYLNCNRPRTFKPSFDSTCHRNHVHISLTHAGAGLRTSWWRVSAGS